MGLLIKLFKQDPLKFAMAPLIGGAVAFLEHIFRVQDYVLLAVLLFVALLYWLGEELGLLPSPWNKEL